MTYLHSTAQTKGKDISDVSPGLLLTPLMDEDALESAVDALTVSLAPFAPADMAQDDEFYARTEPLAFPNGFSGAYTSRLRALMPVFLAQLFTMFSPASVARGAASRTKDIRAALSALYAAEKQNFAAALTHALQRSPALQSQVKDDLGGDAALSQWEKRWEARRKKHYAADQTQVSQPENEGPACADTAQRKPRAEAAPSGRKTDRTGLFCLAPIPAAAAAVKSYTQAGSRPGRGRSMALALRGPRPVPLTPAELRPSDKRPACDPVSPERLQDIWHEMQSEHGLWSDLLVRADFMLTSRAFRLEFAPP